MSTERDLLPWVLGAVLATAVAFAIAAMSSNKTAAPAQAPPVVAAQPTPLPAQAPASPDASSPAPQPPAAPLTAQQSSEQVQAATESAAPTGQIWECTTNGVKTFSNNPCGEKSTRLEIGPVNTMNPTPAVRYARTYATDPRYAPAYGDSDSADQDSYSDQASAESGGNPYTTVQAVGFVSRRRPEHSHHRPTPHHRNIGRMQR
jgi:hypothetical protein